MSDFDGRVVLVLGAAGAVGLAVSKMLAERSAKLVGVISPDDDPGPLDAMSVDTGGGLRTLVATLDDQTSIAAAAEQAIEWRGGVDALVSTVGMVQRREIADVSSDDWQAALATNVMAPFFMAQVLGEHLAGRPGAAIVNVTSVSGVVSSTGAPIQYAACKAALAHATRILAARWAPEIRVNAVAPGYVRTELTAKWLDDPANAEFALGGTALGRLAEPAEVAEAVCFLASPRSAHITGQELLVDGGWRI